MTDHPIYGRLDGLKVIDQTRWQWNPRRWTWQTYTSPSSKFVVKWRGPRIRTFYHP